MLEIDFRNATKLINPAFLPLFEDTHPTHVLVGGAASSKSYSTAQKIIYKMVKDKGHRFLICRKVKKDVRHSCYDLLKGVIKSFGLDNLFVYNDTETIIKCTLNGNDAIGVGLDDVNKLKSIYNATDFWLEEADQATEDDYNQLHLRLRGETDFVKQETLTMNPIWIEHWVKKRFFDKQDDTVLTHRSTYRDNKFLDKETIAKLEAITDPYYKMVYVEGEWGVYGNRVFTNFVIEDFDYREDDLENVFTGMDFGFAHASAIERGGFRDGEMYVFDELYGKGWTNTEFIQAAKDYWGDRAYYFRIIADSAEPDRIKEWQEAGYHVEPAVKGPGSLGYGINFLCSVPLIHIHKTNCPNLAREMQTFKRKEDRNGTPTEEFVEVNDDTISCLTGNTLVNTKNGDFKIKDLVGKTGEVYSFDGEHTCFEKFSSVSLTRHSAIVYTIEMEDGGVIEATEDHPILTSRGWVLVKNLKEDDEVIQIGKN